MIRSLVLPALLAIWGIAVVVNGLAGDSGGSSNSSYELGGTVALFMGVAMAAVGAFYFVRALRERS